MKKLVDDNLKILGLVALFMSPFAYTTYVAGRLGDKIETLSHSVDVTTGELKRMARRDGISSIEPAVDTVTVPSRQFIAPYPKK